MSKGRLSTVPKRLSSVPPQIESKVDISSWRGSSNGGATARGYTYRWEQYRKRYLQQHPLCVYCEREGRVTAANVVDHIEPHQGNQSLFWDSSNHQSLCKTCHDSTKAKEERLLGYR